MRISLFDLGVIIGQLTYHPLLLWIGLFSDDICPS